MAAPRSRLAYAKCNGNCAFECARVVYYFFCGRPTCWNPMSVAQLDIALKMFDCWRRRDLEAALGLLSPHAVFQADCKSSPVVGREAIRKVWAGYMQVISRYECEVRTQLASERLVFVERSERLALAGRELLLPIVAVFEFNDKGQISAWRDYWDASMVGSP
jgi:limonene-1,2-epoxide hydrolase